MIRFARLAALAMAAISLPSFAASQRIIDAPASTEAQVRIWRSTPPAGSPFKQSRSIAAMGFTGRHSEYTNADTWYPSWASDGNMYSPFTDGDVYGVRSGSFGEGATTGSAKIVGDDPMSLKIEDASTFVSSSLPYGGRYPCGSLVYNGVWYYGTYCLTNENGANGADTQTEIGQVNWGVLGPFVGFRHSTDFGKTWVQTKHTPSDPIFPEPSKMGAPVRIGSPHFVDLGKNMQYSPDGKAYLVAHGAAVPDPKPRIANASWITGDCIYLLRVVPSIENVDDGSKYEFYGGQDASGNPVWTKDFGRIKPLVDWNNHCGCVTMTYNAPLKKYLMCITDGWPTTKAMDTYVLESDSITGPWKMVSYMRAFGTQAYFVNIPSKFISPDGRTAWLCYSANFTRSTPSDPPGSRYGMCLQEIKLLSQPQADAAAVGPLESAENVARSAVVSASSTARGYSPRAAIDGVIGGFQAAAGNEWATAGEARTGMLRLDWEKDQLVDRVWLFDRPNTDVDQVTSGLLILSDGTTIPFGALPDDARKLLEIRFSPRKVNWMIFAVTGSKPGSQNIGFGEVAVFRSGAKAAAGAKKP